MRNTQGLKEFILRWKGSSEPSMDLAIEYKDFCLDLMLEDEEIVREVTQILRKNIESWAIKTSPVYKKYDANGMFSKTDLLDKSSWFVESISHESQPMATSGSTTGAPFSYLRWEPFLYFIEATNHYDLIMDEFSVKENPEILYFFNTSMCESSELITKRSDSKNFMEHHGLKRRANVHYVNYPKFQSDKPEFFRHLFEYVFDNPLDVIFAPGPSINAMCYHMSINGFKSKICGLLSNSNEKLLHDDANFLLKKQHVDHICDHMRCWDGGATFFTCKHQNYHLLDNISWCEEVEEKLVCTDYFSFPSPFVRYWNGDFCRITDKYERCECGRLYRDFEFLDNRPFSLKGRSILEIKNTLDSLKIRDIKQIRCSAQSVEIVSFSQIQDTHKQILRNRHPFNFRFTIENETRPT